MGMTRTLASSPWGIILLILIIIFFIFLFALILLGVGVVIGFVLALMLSIFPIVLILLGLGIMYFLGLQGGSMKFGILGFIIFIIGILSIGWIGG